MSAVMLFALLLQFTSVVLLRHRLGKTWLRRPVTILVLASVVYQGVSPVLLSVPPIGAWDIYRQGVAPQFQDEAVLLLSASMLAFTVAYLLTRPERIEAPEAGIPAIMRAPDWRLLALCCVPLAYLTYAGRGYNGTVSAAPGAPLPSELASSFFVTLIVLAAFALVARMGRGWFLPVLLAQSVLLAAAGERTPVVADAVVLVVLLCHAGLRPSARQVCAAIVLAVITVMAITAARSVQGRSLYSADSGLGARVGALAGSLGASGQGNGSPGLLAGTAVRLDGTDFAAAILQSAASGVPRLSTSAVPESALIVVPSALWPSKLAHAAALNPVGAETGQFGLRDVNFLPGFAGLYAGFLSPGWLIMFLALAGGLAGCGERWLLRSASPARVVMLAAAVIAALSYEKGLPGMLVELRAGAGVAMAMWALGRLRQPQAVRRAVTGSR